MHAIAYDNDLFQRSNTQLKMIDVPTPEASGHDLLVEVRAVSVNPADLKVRAGAQPSPGDYRILGFDAAGVVMAVGDACSYFQPGDAVYYAGAIHRPGSNAQYQLVDERIVAHKPLSLDFAAAAALPLTALTGYEMLFDRLQVQHREENADQLLIIGGAGGVGSMTIQLARQLTPLQITATASQPENIEWCRSLGAHNVVDHQKVLSELTETGELSIPNFVFCTTHADYYGPQLAELMAPQGRLGLIDDPQQFDIVPFKRKSISVHWEFMFTRSMFTTPDITKQRKILTEVAELVDAGKVRHTATKIFHGFNESTFAAAYALIVEGHHHGKVVVAF